MADQLKYERDKERPDTPDEERLRGESREEDFENDPADLDDADEDAEEDDGSF